MIIEAHRSLLNSIVSVLLKIMKYFSILRVLLHSEYASHTELVLNEIRQICPAKFLRFDFTNNFKLGSLISSG